MYSYDDKMSAAQAVIETYSKEHDLNSDDVEYVHQGTCIVSQKHLVTTNLKICSALALKIGDFNLLAHIDALMGAITIISALQDQFSLPIDTQQYRVDIRLYLADIGSIPLQAIMALHAMNVLDRVFCFSKIQEEFRNYFSEKMLHLMKQPNGENQLILYSKGIEFPLVQHFLNLSSLKSPQDLEVFTKVLDILRTAKPKLFDELTTNQVIIVTAEDIVSTNMIKCSMQYKPFKR